MDSKSSTKSQINMSTFISVIFIVLVGMVGVIGLYEIGEEFIIERTANATIEAANQSNVSSTYTNKITSLEQEYKDFSLPYDLIFSAIILMAVIGLLVGSATSEPMSTTQFLFLITIGTFVLALVMTFVGQLVDWYLYDFFYAFFDGVKQDITILNWFFEYIEFIIMLLWVVGLLLNQVKLDFEKLSGQIKKQE